MADVLLVSSITCFAVGLMFSALITYRDFRALGGRQHHASVRWQITLVAFDLVQNALLSCCLGLTIFMMRSHRLNWAEPIVLSAVQSMSATNLSRLLQTLPIRSLVKLPAYATLVASVTIHAVVYSQLDLIDTSIYEFVILLAIAASSTVSGVTAWRQRRLHVSSGTVPNRDVVYFFTALVISSALTTLFAIAGAVVLLLLGRTKSEHGFRIRFATFTVCAGFEALGMFCFVFNATERLANNLALMGKRSVNNLALVGERLVNNLVLMGDSWIKLVGAE